MVSTFLIHTANVTIVQMGETMRKILFAVLVTAMLCVVAAADEVKPPATDLDGFQYMVFAKAGDAGPDPDGYLDVPIFAHFVQQDGVVYWTFVLPLVLDEEALAPAVPFFGYDVWPVYDGSYKGKKLSLKVNDEGMEYQYTLRVLKNGEKLKLTIPDTPGGKYTVQMQRVNADGNYLSGLYIGTSAASFAPPAHVDNTIIGVQILGTKMTILLGYYDDFFNTLVMGITTGTYDPNTGQFNIPAGLDKPEINGTIGNGEMTYTAKFDVDLAPTAEAVVSGKAYFFGNSPAKKLKATRIKPKKMNDGTMLDVKAYHKAARPGCVARIVPLSGSAPTAEALRLFSFQYGAKYLTLTLDAPAGLGGKYKVEITNPDGLEATSKKSLTVK